MAIKTQPYGSPIMGPGLDLNSYMRQLILSQPRPTQESWDAAQSIPRNPNQDFIGGQQGTLQDAQAMYDLYASGGRPPSLQEAIQRSTPSAATLGGTSFADYNAQQAGGGMPQPTIPSPGPGYIWQPGMHAMDKGGGNAEYYKNVGQWVDANGNPYQGATAGGVSGGLPPWVSPQQADFYQTLNAGWKQGHGGQDIPQERFQYLQGAYNDEAAQGPRGSHVGDMNWWQNRAAIDHGPDPGEPGYTGQGYQTLGQMSGSGYSMNPVNGVASFNAPGLAAPYTKEFQPTDINTILNAPAYQAAQANGVDQIQRSAAARGTLLTGGTLKDLAQYTQGLALGELNNQFNRDATTYGTNRDTFYGNQNNAYNKLSGFANTGLDASRVLGAYGSGYANNIQQGANNLGNLAAGQGDANAAATLANAQNTNQTLGNLVSGVDWSKLFKPKTPGLPNIPTNTGGSPTGGAAVPFGTR